MWFLQRTHCISWTAKKSNATIIREADTIRSLINRIRKRQAVIFGDVMRREKQEHLVTAGMMEGKQHKKDVGWTNKVAKSRKNDRSTESDKG